MRTSRTKPQIALGEIDRLIAAGIRIGTVLADAGYGLSVAFRQGLTWAVGRLSRRCQPSVEPSSAHSPCPCREYDALTAKGKFKAQN
jgi:hypothetical protein